MKKLKLYNHTRCQKRDKKNEEFDSNKTTQYLKEPQPTSGVDGA